MKKLTLLFSKICLALITSYAATITVSNNVNSPGQYTDLQTAINAAADGDTLLVAGSASTYGNVTINNKALHLKGVGSKPNKQIPLKTEINILNFTFLASSVNSSGSTIEGFKVNYIKIYGPSGGSSFSSVSNLSINRCDINIEIEIKGKVNDINIFNNRIGSFEKDYGVTTLTSNIIVANNIFNGYFYHRKNNTYPSLTGNIIIKNNLFISNTTLDQCYNATFSNNIFYKMSPYSTANPPSNQMCNFSYNLSFGSVNDNFNTGNYNTGGNNLVSYNPNFISETDFFYQDTDDFHTPTTSPVHNAGSDGSDLGIYGGTYPWPDGGISGSGFMYHQEPQIPQVNEMDILTPIIPVGGNITVTAKGIVNH